MKQRFGMSQKNKGFRNIVISLSIFVVVIICFLWLFSSAGSRAKDEEYTTLKNAVMQDITQCYAIEGTYPESLDYIIENYGLTYDEQSFFIDYRPVGSDVMPDVTIVRRGK